MNMIARLAVCAAATSVNNRAKKIVPLIAEQDNNTWYLPYLPRGIQPLAWCSESTMGIAIPGNIPADARGRRISDEPVYEMNESWWDGDGECKTGYAHNYFGKTRHRRHRMNAFLGWTSKHDCGTTRAQVDGIIYFVNTFSVPHRKYVVSCACARHNSSKCIASSHLVPEAGIFKTEPTGRSLSEVRPLTSSGNDPTAAHKRNQDETVRTKSRLDGHMEKGEGGSRSSRKIAETLPTDKHGHKDKRHNENFIISKSASTGNSQRPGDKQRDGFYDPSPHELFNSNMRTVPDGPHPTPTHHVHQRDSATKTGSTQDSCCSCTNDPSLVATNTGASREPEKLCLTTEPKNSKKNIDPTSGLEKPRPSDKTARVGLSWLNNGKEFFFQAHPKVSTIEPTGSSLGSQCVNQSIACSEPDTRSERTTHDEYQREDEARGTDDLAGTHDTAIPKNSAGPPQTKGLPYRHEAEPRPGGKRRHTGSMNGREGAMEGTPADHARRSQDARALRTWSSVLSSRASIGNDGRVSLIFGDRPFVITTYSYTDSVVTWPLKCTGGDLKTGSKVTIIDDLCPTSAKAQFRWHGGENGHYSLFSIAPFTVNGSDSSIFSCIFTQLERANIARLMKLCNESLVIDNQNDNSLSDNKPLIGEPAPLRHLGGVARDSCSPSIGFARFQVQYQTLSAATARAPQQRHLAEFSVRESISKVMDKSYDRPTSLFSDANTHVRTSDADPVKDQKSKYTLETRSRVSLLEHSLNEGEFGNAPIVNAEGAYLERISSAEQNNGNNSDDWGVPGLYAQMISGPFSISGDVDFSARSLVNEIATSSWYGAIGGARPARSGSVTFGTHGHNLVASYTDATQKAIVGYGKKRYGIRVERNQAARFSGYEIRARNVALLTTTDALERAIGQRVSVRNFGLSVRHDFDSIVNYGPTQYGTEVYLNYRGLSIGVGLDVLDTRYYVSLGILGVNVAATRDFNSFGTNFQINWGRGWQVFIEDDTLDRSANSYGQAIGFGRPTRNYVSVGSGIGETDLFVTAVNVQTVRSAFTAALLDRAAKRLYQASFTVGRFTYTWENTFVVDNFGLPSFG